MIIGLLTKEACRKIAAFFGVDVNDLLTEEEAFAVAVSAEYGSRGRKQAQELIEGMSGLFAFDQSLLGA